jgi:CBS domain-containing protein
MTSMAFSTNPLNRLTSPTAIAEPDIIKLPSSPARALMTDFTVIQPRIIEASTPIDEAHLKMRHGGVRLLLVVDDQQRCIGVLTAKEVIGGRRITQAMQQRGISREGVTVSMVQTPFHKLLTMSLEQLTSMTIDDLVRTLESFGEQHLLITDGIDTQHQRIRGLISASDIGRSLGNDATILPGARSFSDICQVVMGHEL